MRKKEWFETWFNSPYYRICYDLDHKPVEEDFLHRMVHITSLDKGARVLDLGCGLGKDALYLESLGYDVTGIDLSHGNIKEALALESESLGFYQHDMRSAFWINYYDCVFNLFTSFGFFESHVDHVNWLVNSRKTLKENGKIIIDFMNVDFVAEHIDAEQKFSKGLIDFIVNSKIIDGQLIKEIKIIDGEHCYFFEEHIRAFTLDDFEIMFGEAGLKIDRVYGNYNLDPFDNNTAERLIISGSKA